jgi:hypothetical protein
LLTTSADDSPTNNGEEKDDGGCSSNHLISRHVLTSRLSLFNLDGHVRKATTKKAPAEVYALVITGVDIKKPRLAAAHRGSAQGAILIAG